MKDSVLRFISDNGLLSGADRVLVAFSGGADSSALLDFFVQNARELGVSVCAAHFNHRIRGGEAERDLNFCRAVCERLGIPFFSGEGDVPAYAAKNGLSTEMAARKLRYEFLEERAASQGALLATAHNADDNLETMILNLVRGTGARGVCGIPPRRGSIIRPILCVSRAQILQYCDLRGLEYVTDSTNAEDDCGRNCIRHKVIPVLREQNPAVESDALRTALLLREGEEYLEQQAALLLEKAAACAGMPAAYDCAVLRAAPKPLRSRAAIAILEQNGVCRSFAAINELDELICAGSGHRTLQGIPFDACKNLLTAAESECDIEPVTLALGENSVGGRKINLKMVPGLGEVDKNYFKSSLNYDMIKGAVVAGSRKPGDVFRRIGADGGKTLKKLFNELGIPQSRRNRLLVLRDDLGVIFVEGLGADRRVAPQSGSSALQIEIEGDWQG